MTQQDDDTPLAAADFAAAMSTLRPGEVWPERMAIALSGGPDSLALAALMAEWAKTQTNAPTLVTLTVDHGLRTESSAEARDAGRVASDMIGMDHHILTWTPDTTPETRLMERARAARYALLDGYCRDHAIGGLLIAHHRDDQAETLLMRLAKGSGLDGLAGMAPRGPGRPMRFRPLLAFPKSRLIATCHARGLPFVADPMNENTAYLRPRLRAALAEDGMTAATLATTATRLATARAALDHYAHAAYAEGVREESDSRIVFSLPALAAHPEETFRRVLAMALERLCPARAYQPRRRRLDDIAADLHGCTARRRHSLAGCLITAAPAQATLTIELEAA